jgi:hypothetical protein
MEDLTLEEQLVYAVLEKSRPKDIDALTGETGLTLYQVQMAAMGLSRKMLARFVIRKETSGYVKFLDRYVG